MKKAGSVTHKFLYSFALCFLIHLSSEATGLGRQTPVKKISVSIVDEAGRPTAARVRISENDSIYFAPDGHTTDFAFTNYGGDVILDNNRRFAYVEGTFTIGLPANSHIRFEVVKGFAYTVYDSVVNISNSMTSVNIRLKKWFAFPGRKWYSGDVHVHFIDPATALTEMRAEDLNVCNILTSDFSGGQELFKGSVEPISDSLHLIYVNQEYREDRLGHVDLLNLKKLIEPATTMRKFHYPLNIEGLGEAQRQGGHVSWAHFAAWPGLEGPLAIVLKKVDAVELLSTIEPFSEPAFVTDIVPDLRMNSGLRLWYRLLNCGLKVPATAGTDKMSNWVTVGANRVYALTEGEFTYQRWIDALNKGATFISNSPFIFCSVDGKNPGDEIQVTKKRTVKIVAEVWSQFPLDRLEIVQNGKVIAQRIIEKDQHHAALEIEFKPEESSWIAARAHQYNEGDRDDGVSFLQRRDFGGGPTFLNQYYGTLRPETTFAHTSPTYVLLDGQPIRSKDDARYFVSYLENSRSWLEKSGRFPSPEAKQEVLKAFENGKRLFAALAEVNKEIGK